jgi:hypothetical protein
VGSPPLRAGQALPLRALPPVRPGVRAFACSEAPEITASVSENVTTEDANISVPEPNITEGKIREVAKSTPVEVSSADVSATIASVDAIPVEITETVTVAGQKSGDSELPTPVSNTSKVEPSSSEVATISASQEQATVGVLTESDIAEWKMR